MHPAPGKWSRKRKIACEHDWRPLCMSRSLLDAQREPGRCGGRVVRVGGDGAVVSGSAERGGEPLEENGEEARETKVLGLVRRSHKLGGGAADMDLHNIPPPCTVLPQYHLLKLFKSFRLQSLQQDHRPLKIVRAHRQYLYDNTNSEYLDCVNSASHVGHCHPAVARAAYTTTNVDTVAGWSIDWGEAAYPRHLRDTLPDHLDTFLFCNSGSEAVDLSLQLSLLYTGGTEAVVTDNAFHGSTDSVHHLSPKVFKATNTTKADWVHVVPMPDLYRGHHQPDDPAAVDQYLADTSAVIRGATLGGRKIACFISEPMLVVPGCIIPPPVWLQEIYKMVRECGGLCIADEVQTSLGRIGTHFWSFQAQEVTPDIVIIGKTVGNGYPMASVITSKEIAAVLGERVNEYRCTQVMDSVGCAVLEVLRQEHLMASAIAVGALLLDELVKLQHKHEYLGEVRGRGLLLGVEVVWSKQSKKPSQEIAEQIVQRMREEYVILANEGYYHNIIMMMPPMCFTRENALSLAHRLDKVLSELPSHRVSKEEETSILTCTLPTLPGLCEGRLGIVQPQQEEEEEGEGVFCSRDSMDLEYSQHSYQDLD